MRTSTTNSAAVALLVACLAVPAVRAQGEWTETVEVHGRLGAGGPRRLSTEVADVEVHDAQEIAASGARSLPEYLAQLASVSVADETGNGRQLGLDLRGFAGGSGGTAVVVDGVRFNDADTNLASLELIPLEDVERIEIVKGPRGATLGGGSLAGVIHVIRKHPERRAGGEVAARGGSFALAELRGHATAPAGRAWSILAGGSLTRADGFRDRGGFREAAGRFEAARHGKKLDLTASWAHLDGRWEQPGALTAQEWKDDPTQASWNWLDYNEGTNDLLALRLAPAKRGGRTDWVGVLSWRDRRGETLSTGRSGYGFLTRSTTRGAGATFEALTTPRSKRWSRLALRWGAELASERLSPNGFATDSVEDGHVDSLTEWSDTDVDWDRAALFAGLEVKLTHGLLLECGLRRDDSRVARDGVELSFDTGRMEQAMGRRSFGDTQASLSFGGSHGEGKLSGHWHAGWAQSFQAPSSIQLFAFPGYGSNEDLRPAQGQGFTLAGGIGGQRWNVDLETFLTDVQDEIVYDDAARRNENAARTRRRGCELSFGAKPHPLVRVDARLALTDAEFRSKWGGSGGASKGDAVPLVPESRACLAVALGPFRGTSVDLSWRRTGEAVLGSDFDNSLAPLPSFDVVGVSVRHAWTVRHAVLELAGSADNLLDETYATRGIDAPQGPYFTPAPPRALTVGLTASF